MVFLGRPWSTGRNAMIQIFCTEGPETDLAVFLGPLGALKSRSTICMTHKRPDMRAYAWSDPRVVSGSRLLAVPSAHEEPCDLVDDSVDDSVGVSDDSQDSSHQSTCSITCLICVLINDSRSRTTTQMVSCPGTLRNSLQYSLANELPCDLVDSLVDCLVNLMDTHLDSPQMSIQKSDRSIKLSTWALIKEFSFRYTTQMIQT